MATGTCGKGGAAANITQPEDHENVLFTTDTLPGPDTNIGHSIADTPIDTQRQIAIDFFTFLTSENKQLSQMNADNVPHTHASLAYQAHHW